MANHKSSDSNYLAHLRASKAKELTDLEASMKYITKDAIESRNTRTT